ncbi:MAG: hypothetical protein GXO17_01165 [Thermodesulfobacteria bacterium]|nr:hypothetical protein [Thermodesulfobacteriota bacterium]
MDVEALGWAVNLDGPGFRGAKEKKKTPTNEQEKALHDLFSFSKFGNYFKSILEASQNIL